MNPKSKTLVSLLFFLLFLQEGYPQWAQTSGPKGWDISEITSIGSTLFAATRWGGSVFISADGGHTWRSASSGLPAGGNGIGWLRRIGTILFASNRSALFRSTNSGASWQIVRLSSEIGEMGDITQLGKKLFLSTARGLYESPDDGNSWLMSNAELRFLLGSSGGARFATVDTFLFFGGRRGVFRTSLNVKDWTWFRAGLPDTIVENIASVGNAIFVLAEPKPNSRGRILRSTDLGATWEYAENGLPDTIYSSGALKAIESDLYTMGWQGVYRSSDLGASWSPVKDTLADIWEANGIRYAQRSFEDGTLLQSIDHGVTWRPLCEPPVGTSITALAGRGNQLVAATWNDQWDYITTDRGDAWSRLSKDRVNLNISSFVFCGPYLIAGGTSTDGGIDVSTDNGSTWVRVTNGSDAQIEYVIADSPYVFASGNGMWVSTNCGFSWSTSNKGLRAGLYLGAMARIDSSLFVAEYWGDSVFVSKDKGTSWKPAGAATLRSGSGITSLFAQAGTLFIGTEGQGIWCSSDRGVTWTPSSAGVEDTVVLDFAADRGVIFAASQDKGVYASSDGGKNWKPINEGLAAPHVNRLLVQGSNLYAGTLDAGVWRRPLSQLTGNDEGDGTLPAEFLLEQNYPNPFNPTTNIRYHLPALSISERQARLSAERVGGQAGISDFGYLKLAVYDLLGREVAVLVNEQKTAGRYEVRFDARGLASGVYLYRMIAGSFSSCRKMVLTR